MKMNMSISPEEILGKIEDLTKNMQLEKGADVQFLRTDKKKNIWTLKVCRNGVALRFSDFNRTTEQTVRGQDIKKIVNSISRLSSCYVDKPIRKGDFVVRYTIMAVEKTAVA